MITQPQQGRQLWHHHPMADIEHYENFPVASWLCPAHLRPPITAIYHFARTADDLADEGDAPAAERLAQLQAYRHSLQTVLQSTPCPSPHWPHVFGPLAQATATHALPGNLLHALLDAFEQDVRHTHTQTLYANESELLDYCALSANPVGRLLLHLYGVTDAQSLQQSDAICSALQLINFWQDLSVDLPRQRCYLPNKHLNQHHLRWQDLLTGHPLTAEQDQAAQAMVAQLLEHACTLMRSGAPLALRLPGRVGWELRLVVQGGLRIAEKIRALQWRTWHTRPRLRAHDAPLLLWRAARMTAQHA